VSAGEWREEAEQAGSALLRFLAIAGPSSICEWPLLDRGQAIRLLMVSGSMTTMTMNISMEIAMR